MRRRRQEQFVHYFLSPRSIFGYVWDNFTLWVYPVAFFCVFGVPGQPGSAWVSPGSALGQPWVSPAI